MAVPSPEILRVEVDEAKRRLDAGEAIIVDVRSAEAYATSHISGARSIPGRGIGDAASALPRDKEIVLY